MAEGLDLHDRLWVRSQPLRLSSAATEQVHQMYLGHRSYGVYVGRMLSPIGRNAFFSCSRFSTKINDLSKLTDTNA